MYKGVKLRRGEDSFEPVLNILTPLSPTLTPFFYLPLFNSVAPKIFLGKILEGHSLFLAPYPQVTRTVATVSQVFG